MPPADSDLNVIVIVRGGHRWIFLYDDASLDALCDLVGRWAFDNDRDFSSYDAFCLCRAARELKEESQGCEAKPRRF